MTGGSDSVHRLGGGLFRYSPATCTHSANCAEDRRDPTGAVLGLGLDARCCTMTGAWVTTVQKTVEVSQLLFSDKALTMLARSFGWGKMQSRGILDRTLSWGILR